MNKCPLTGSRNTKIIYKQYAVPLIQNISYHSREEARAAKCIDVALTQSLDTGFVFNANFDESIIKYDTQYQNEQGNSAHFQKHLENVIEILEENKVLDGKVVEIACGKGYFLEMLLQRGVDVTGFDPAYEGDSLKIISDFFSDKHADLRADLIILRLALDHIAKPFHFIKTIATANNNKGKIYIEVPAFEWIMASESVEDIFYEHCNYFTLDTLRMFFSKSIGYSFFEGQYIYILADLADLKNDLEVREILPYKVRFAEKILSYQTLLNRFADIAIWGGGAKGSTFLNLLDNECNKVRCVVEINPKKQHKYIGGTGHYIIKPDELNKWGIKNVLVMNSNYIKEIKEITDPLNITLITLKFTQ